MKSLFIATICCSIAVGTLHAQTAPARTPARTPARPPAASPSAPNTPNTPNTPSTPSTPSTPGEAGKKDEGAEANKGVRFILLSSDIAFPDPVYLLQDKAGTVRPLRITGGHPTLRVPPPTSVGQFVFYKEDKPVVIAAKPGDKITQPLAPPKPIPATMPDKVLGLISFDEKNAMVLDFMAEAQFPIGTCLISNRTKQPYMLNFVDPPKGEPKTLLLNPGQTYVFGKELAKAPQTATFGCRMLHQVTPKNSDKPVWLPARKFMIDTCDDRKCMLIIYPSPNGKNSMLSGIELFN